MFRPYTAIISMMMAKTYIWMKSEPVYPPKFRWTSTAITAVRSPKNAPFEVGSAFFQLHCAFRTPLVQYISILWAKISLSPHAISTVYCKTVYIMVFVSASLSRQWNSYVFVVCYRTWQQRHLLAVLGTLQWRVGTPKPCSHKDHIAKGSGKRISSSTTLPPEETLLTQNVPPKRQWTYRRTWHSIRKHCTLRGHRYENLKSTFWRWRKNVSPKHRWISIWKHDIISYKMVSSQSPLRETQILRLKKEAISSYRTTRRHIQYVPLFSWIQLTHS
jgi:hypothetical protein